MSIYYTLLTDTGAAKMAFNDANVLPTEFAEIALGDNNGSFFTPQVTDGDCVHQVYRANINSITIDPDDDTIIIIQLVIPASTGGFTIREARIYDADGIVIYTANTDAIPKPILADGMANDLNLLFRVKRANTSQVTLLVDTSITLASHQYVINAITAHNADAAAHAALLFATKKGVQDCTYNYAAAHNTSTTTAYKANYTPAVTALTDGMELTTDISAIGTNTTTTPTFSPDGLTAYTIKHQGGLALRSGDLPPKPRLKYDSATTSWILLNPATTGELLNVQTFKVAGTFTYTPTAGTKYYIVEAMGGGGGGGATASTTSLQICIGDGGSSGAYGKGVYFPVDPAATVSVTVGAAGVGGVADGAAATAGGTSSFGAYLSVSGGGGCPTGTSTSTQTLGNKFPTDSNIITGANIASKNSEIPTIGIAMNAAQLSCNAGASSPFGVGGLPSFSSSGSVNGVNATGNAAGGGGAATVPSSVAKSGGNGTPGIVIVWEYR